MPLVRLNGLASMENRKQRTLIDWSPEMRVWPGSDFPLLDTMEGVEGGEREDSEDLKFAQRYFIKLTEECDEAETDSRIDN